MTDHTAGPEAPADRFRRLAAAFSRTVDAIPPGGWANPSPCAGWSAGDVLGHVIDSYGSFLGRAGLSIPPGPTVAEDPAAAWAHAAGAVQAILDDPAQAGREYDSYAGRSTIGQTFGSFMSIDLIVHRWDIAHATGVDEMIPAGDIAFVRSFADGMGDMLRSSGAFGAAVVVPEGADEQTRLLAFLGRSAA